MIPKRDARHSPRRDDRRGGEDIDQSDFTLRRLRTRDDSRPSPLCPGCGLPCSMFGTRRAFREHREGCEA